MTTATLSMDRTTMPMQIDGEDVGLFSGVIVALGGLWKIVTLSSSRREKWLDNRIGTHVKALETRLASAEADRLEAITRANNYERQNAKLTIIIQMMANEVERLDPDSKILTHVRAVLMVVPPLEPTMPSSISDIVANIT